MGYLLSISDQEKNTCYRDCYTKGREENLRILRERVNASSDSEERDLYLQTTYSVNDTDKSLTPQPGGLGILIAGTEIGSIEFIREENT